MAPAVATTSRRVGHEVAECIDSDLKTGFALLAVTYFVGR